MSPLSENPSPRLFRFEPSPHPMIAMDEHGAFRECMKTLTEKLKEYKARRPEMEKIPHTDPRRMMFECKTAIVCELWSKGKVYLKEFGKTPGKPDRYDPATLQEAFMEIINELEVDL